jgi:hypothetical protein
MLVVPLNAIFYDLNFRDVSDSHGI